MTTFSEVVIDDIIDIYLDFRGKTPKKLGMDWGGGDIKALSANNVEKGKINFEKECYLASEKLYQKWMHKGDCQKGDIVLTMEAPLGNIAQIPDDRKYILSQRTILLKTNQEWVHNNFLYFVLLDEKFQHELLKNSSGTTATGIQQKRLAKIKISLPPLPTQRKIARILSTIDGQIEKTEAILAKYQAVKQGMLQDLFTRGIDVRTGQLRPRYEDAPDLYQASALGMIPKEWAVRKLNEVADYVDYRGKTPPKSEVGIFLVTAKNVKEGYIDYDASQEYIPEANFASVMSRGTAEVGDVLITTEAPMGNVAQVNRANIALAQRVIKYRGKTGVIENGFLRLVLMSRSFQDALIADSSGSTVTGIKGSRLHKMKIITPNLTEQQYIKSIAESLEKRLEGEQRSLFKLHQLKQGMMQDLLSGKVVVTA